MHSVQAIQSQQLAAHKNILTIDSREHAVDRISRASLLGVTSDPPKKGTAGRLATKPIHKSAKTSPVLKCGTLRHPPTATSYGGLGRGFSSGPRLCSSPLQFPIADARPFVPTLNLRLPFPDWPNPSQSQFVHSLPVRRARGLENRMKLGPTKSNTVAQARRECLDRLETRHAGLPGPAIPDSRKVPLPKTVL